ncbi:hypothetical protein FS842_010408 [Serendipita sp. 407]|nr:hypothetical protein FS842_010408 [Serendipita sp. 407]
MFENPATRILVVPSNASLGNRLIERITGNQITQAEEKTEWKISNKYYTANVHLHRAPWRDVIQALTPGIPAVVVLWEKGEDYEYILGRYTTEWEILNAEVMLAVAVGQKTIDMEAVEDFCSEVGFELVDLGEEIPDASIENIGLNRIMEALQTIMWPTLVMKPQPRTHRSQASIERAKTGTSNLPSFTDNVQDEPLEKKPALEEPTIDQAKAQLEAWLEHDDPWPRSDASKSSGPGEFDDDFANFVSAPARDEKEEEANPKQSAFDTPVLSDPKQDGDKTGTEIDEEDDEGKFDFDFPNDDDYKELLDDEMPSSEEILKTSQRIFGRSFASRESPDGEGEDNDDDPGDFDLGSIMGALQNMKEEIAGISNEEEKRKAAARVALGLVWGLEGGRGL